MTRTALIVSMALLGLVSMAGSANPYQPLDECTEGGFDWTGLPEGVPSQLAIKPCTDCAPILLSVDAATRFMVGEDAVPLSVLQQYARRDGRQVRVCHDTDHKVTRIKVSGVLDAADLPQ